MRGAWSNKFLGNLSTNAFWGQCGDKVTFSIAVATAASFSFCVNADASAAASVSTACSKVATCVSAHASALLSTLATKDQRVDNVGFRPTREAYPLAYLKSGAGHRGPQRHYPIMR
jgi:hypothetical protein